MSAPAYDCFWDGEPGALSLVITAPAGSEGRVMPKRFTRRLEIAAQIGAPVRILGETPAALAAAHASLSRLLGEGNVRVIMPSKTEALSGVMPSAAVH